MPSDQRSAIQAVFIMAPKVHLLDITGPAQIFYEAASNGAPVKLIFSTIFADQTESESCCALSFHRLTPYDQLLLHSGDLVFVPGIESSLLSDKVFFHSSRPFQRWLADMYKTGITICSVCTGAFLLAECGLLDGRACTTHWEYTEQLKDRYPKIRLQTNRLFVHDDRIYTSAGIASGIDLSLYLIEQFWGACFAAKIAKEAVIYFRRGMDDPQLNIFTQYRNHIDHRIHRVQDLLIKSPGRNHTLEELASKVCMSARNLTRLFKKTTQITIGAYLDQIRAAHAEKLLAEGHTLKEATLLCGLKRTNQLRHLLTPQRLTTGAE
jgi:transcriptional regulator GlxA family with amidase domain